jgi:hypothetical protein
MMATDHDRSEEARAILRANDRGGYTVPTDRLYPFQWNWDSAFCAIGFATFDEPRAFDELDSLFKGQWADGLVPHIVFHQPADSYFPGPDMWGTHHNPPTSGITQPPVAGFALRRILAMAKDTAMAQARAATLYPKILAWHRWWESARDPHKTGLVAILHPWESGSDNSIAWDKPLARVPATTTPYQRKDLGHVDDAMRPRKRDYDRYMHLLECYRAEGWKPDGMWRASPFKVADLNVNAILRRSEADLLALAKRFGTAAQQAEIAGRLERMISASETLWWPERRLYRPYDLMVDEPINAATQGGFLPLFAGLKDQARVKALAAEMRRWHALGRFGMPTVAPDDPLFEPRRYWRGPIWGIINWMLAEGLADHGEIDLAETLRADTRRLIETQGFAEYFDPLDGTGLGGNQFSWTAAVGLCFALSG